MIRLVRDVAKKVLYASRYYDAYSYLKAPEQPRLLVVMYHHLVEDEVWKSDATQRGHISRTQFATQIQLLKKHYRVITIEQAIEEIRTEGRLTRPSAAITFDDGYASNYHIGLPVMKQLDVTATVYLPTDWINRRMTPWWLMLSDVIRKCDVSKIQIPALQSALGEHLDLDRKVSSDIDMQRMYLRNRIEASLRYKPDQEITSLINSLKGTLEVGSQQYTGKTEALTWDQIREMDSHGIRFGAHTCSHLNFRYADPATIESEIADSKREIENRIDTPVTGFAYPYGQDCAAYTNLGSVLKKYDIRYAVTACYGNNCGDSDLYMMRRITLPQTDSNALLGRRLTLDYLHENEELN